MIYTKSYDSLLGEIFLSSNGESLTGLWFKGQKYFAAGISKYPPEEISQGKDDYALKAASEWLDRYFGGGHPLPDKLPLSPSGTAFQRTVWKLLLKIPYGETTTYGALSRLAAEKLGRKSMSAQAIGSAVGRNPISIIIPCHRVVGADGSLTGYAGGLERKEALLRLEGTDPARPFAGNQLWKGNTI